MDCKGYIEGVRAHLIIVILRRVPLDWKLSQILREVGGHVIYIDEIIWDIASRDCSLTRSMLCAHKVCMVTHLKRSVHPSSMNSFSVQFD